MIVCTLQFSLAEKLRNADGAWVEFPWEQSNKWSPKLFEVMTFGHLPAAIDWLWMRSLQDPSYSHVPSGVHPPAFYDLDLATDLDPAYFEAYNDGSNYLAVIRDDEIGARDLLLKAENFRVNLLPAYPLEFQKKFWSNSWAIPLMQAYVYLFELDDLKSAAHAFKAASAITGAPEYLASLVARFDQPLGEYDVGLRLLAFLHDGSKEEKVKENYKSQIQNLRLARYLRQVEAAFAEARKGKTSLSPDRMQEYWNRFMASSGINGRDPLGGKLSFRADGSVTTTTHYEPVFGLK